MTEEQNQNSEIREVAPQVEAEVNEINEAQQPVQEPVTNQHLKAMRLKNDELQRELKQLRDAQMQMMQAAQMSAMTGQPPQPAGEPNPMQGHQKISKGKGISTKMQNAINPDLTGGGIGTRG